MLDHIEDHRRFEDLYRRWYRPVVRLCRQRLGSEHDAEAVAQEAFVRAWRSWRRYAEDRPFGPWVKVIAIRLCSSEAKITSRRRGILDRHASDMPVSVDDGFTSAVRSHGVGEALRALTPRARRLIVLRHVEGLSYKDIARLDGVPLETVRSGLRRSRAAFRAAYQHAVGPPIVVAASRPGLVQRVRRVIERLSWPGRPHSLEPVVAGVVLLLAPMAPAVSALVPVTEAPTAVVPAASSAAEPAPASIVVVPPSVVAQSGAKAVDVVVEAATAVASDVVDPVTEGESYRFAVSPNYDEDRTVFALGRVPGCGFRECAVLLKSTDGGSTWGRLPADGVEPGRVMLPPAYPHDDRIFVATTVVAGAVDALSLSTDGGRTFAQVANGIGSPSMAMSPSFSGGDPRILMGATDYQPALVYNADTDTVAPLALPLPVGASPRHFVFASDGATVVSAQRGSGWTTVFRCHDGACTDVLDVRPLDLPTFGPVRLSRAGGAVFAWTPQFLYRSVDDGRSFEPIRPLPWSSAGGALEAVADAGGRVYARMAGLVGTPPLYASDDRGATWTKLPNPHGWSLVDMVVLPDGVMLAAPFPVNAPSFVCSTDGGATWSSHCDRV